MTQSQKFPSASSIVSWAGASQIHRFDDEIVYVCKDGVWNYFGWYNDVREYRLICTGLEDLGEQE